VFLYYFSLFPQLIFQETVLPRYLLDSCSLNKKEKDIQGGRERERERERKRERGREKERRPKP
jgi:hypothetical protein